MRPLPPRPKVAPMVRRTLVAAALGAVGCAGSLGGGGGPPQVNCGGHYAGSCRGELHIVVTGEDGAPIKHQAVKVRINAEEEVTLSTDAKGEIWLRELSLSTVGVVVNADGFATATATATVDDQPE